MYITDEELERRLDIGRQRGATEEQIEAKRAQILAIRGQPKPKDNFITSTVKAIADPAIKAGRDAVGSVVAGGSAVGEAISRIGDPQNKNKFFDKGIKLGTKIMTPQFARATSDTSMAGANKSIGTGIQRGAGVASYMIPGGKTLKGAAGLGAASGALYGASQGDKLDINNITGGAAGGAVGGAAGYGISKVPGLVKNVYNKGKGAVQKTLANDATQAYNKASPSMYQKAIEEHGLDINELTRKHVPAGADYDAMLGTIKERGKGGVLGEKMAMAESQLDDAIEQAGGNIRIGVDEFADGLNSEIRALKGIPGNENNIKALEGLVKETKKLYKNGLSAKKLLSLKRTADSKYGAAVVDENTGSVAAQFQKSLGNFARSKLKYYFPEIADALDLETEIFTLRPVLERARGTLGTQGSTIRTGKWSNVGINPTTWGGIPDAIYNSNPSAASRVFSAVKPLEPVIGSGAIKSTATLSPIASFANDFVGNRGGFVGSRVGGLVGGTEKVEPYSQDEGYYPENGVSNNAYGNNGNGQANHSAIINPASNVATPKQTGPVMPMQARLLKSQGVDLKQLWVVHPDGTKIWNPSTQKWVAYNKDVYAVDKPKALTDKQRSYVGAGRLAQDIGDILDSQQSLNIGPVAGRLSKLAEVIGTEQEQQTALKSKIALARTAAKNALLGANMSPQEIESLIDATFDINLPRNVLRERVNQFIQGMNTLAVQDTTGINEGGMGL